MVPRLPEERQTAGLALGESTGRVPQVLMLVLILALIALPTVAWGAPGETVSSDKGLDATSAMSMSAKAAVYGLALLAVCLLSLKVPDAPMLLLVFSMPIIEFQGLRVALTLLQCMIVCLRTEAVRHLVPSWPLSVFLICITASASWALDPRESLLGESVGVIAMLMQVPIAIAARALLSTGLTSARRLLWALTLGCIPGCGLVAYHALAGITWHEGNKAYYMGFLRPDIFSPMLVMSGVFLLSCVTSRIGGSRGKLLAGGLLPVVCLTLLLSGVRSGWVAFLIAAAVMLVLSRSWAGLAGVCAAGAVLIVLWFTAAGSLGMEDQLSARLSQQSLETGEMRVQYWEVALQGFLRRPLLGIGWGMFPPFLADSLGLFMLTHNIFMRIACELGVVGVALFLAWVTITILRVHPSPDGRLIEVLILGMLVQGLFLDHFTGNYFWLFLGLGDGVSGHRQHQGLVRAQSGHCSLRSCTDQVAA